MSIVFEGKLSDDLNVNNNKWNSGSCNVSGNIGNPVNSLLQNSIQNSNNNNHHHQLLNNNNKQTSFGGGLSNHHHHSAHHHHALSLSSPFSSLLSGSSAGYLLDPLGGLTKPTTANHLF